MPNSESNNVTNDFSKPYTSVASDLVSTRVFYTYFQN